MFSILLTSVHIRTLTTPISLKEPPPLFPNCSNPLKAKGLVHLKSRNLRLRQPAHILLRPLRLRRLHNLPHRQLLTLKPVRYSQQEPSFPFFITKTREYTYSCNARNLGTCAPGVGLSMNSYLLVLTYPSTFARSLR